MDDPVSLVLVILIGILAIFFIVRIAKAASRTVDKEQDQAAQPGNTAGGAEVKQVKAGMSFAEVEGVLGPPATRVDLAEKVLYKYKDMTIEFHSGKVADVR
jgi:hypothetical protein